MNIIKFGWTDFFKSFDTKENYTFPGRVTKQEKGIYTVFAENGEFNCQLSGKFRYDNHNTGIYPTIGDWVGITTENTPLIHYVFPRKSFISRSYGEENEKTSLIAANVDYVFIMTSFDCDLSVPRLERYINQTLDGKSVPVIIINKSDLEDNYQKISDELYIQLFGVDIFPVSVKTGEGMNKVIEFMKSGKTYVLCGSSGVGKSSMINFLSSEELAKTFEVRHKDSKGRHTTTNKELYILENGAVIIDTPGMREFGVISSAESINTSFEDILTLSLKCKFSNCKHENEPGCAVLSAINNDKLSIERLDNYKKLLKEAEYASQKQSDKKSGFDKKRTEKLKEIAKLCKQMKKKKPV